MLLKFPGFCDTARIVDPASHRFWMINHENESILEGTCYDFWKRDSACKNCISARAFISDSVQYKIDRQGQKIFLVLAIPRMAGKNTYIVELLKNITEDIPSVETGTEKSVSGFSEKYAGLRSRVYIDQTLPKEIRRSQISGEPFSFLLLALGFPDSFPSDADGGETEELLQSFTDKLSSLTGQPGSWVGHYTGNVFLISLERADCATACQAGERIKSGLEHFLSARAGSGPNGNDRLRVIYSVKTLTDPAADAGSLIQSAWTDLCAAGLNRRVSV